MRVRYRTYEFDERDLHVRTLRDRQEYDDPDNEALDVGIGSANWSLFGVVWDSAEVLARMMWTRNFCGEKILEIGCGIGLASLVLSMRSQNISATDQHPESPKFLSFNSELNDLPPIPFELSRWEQPASSPAQFDLIIGSDVLYEQASLAPLSSFITHHARANCEVVIVDPNRGLRAKFSKQMVKQGFVCNPHTKVTNHHNDEYRGCVLSYERKTV